MSSHITEGSGCKLKEIRYGQVSANRLKKSKWLPPSRCTPVLFWYQYLQMLMMRKLVLMALQDSSSDTDTSDRDMEHCC